MKTFDEIVAILSSQNNPAKVVLLQELVKTPPQTKADAISLIVKGLLQDPDVSVRFWAKKVVNSSAPNEQPFSETNDIDDSLGSQELLKLLEASKSSSDVNHIIQKIFGKKDPSSFPGLITFLKKCKDAVVIATVVKNLGIAFPTEQTLVAVFPYLKYDDERVIANCIEGISNIPSTKTVEVISQLLNHKNHRIRANAAKALSKQEPIIAKKAIQNMLQMREKQHFILAACNAIQQMGGEEFLPELIKLAPHPILGEPSLMAIVAIGGDNAIGYLLELKITCDGEISKRIDLAIQQIQRNVQVKKVEQGISAAINTGTEIISSLGSWIMNKNSSSPKNDQDNIDEAGNEASSLTKEVYSSSVEEQSPLTNQSGNVPITCPFCGNKHKKKFSKQCEFCGKQIGGNPPKGPSSVLPSVASENRKPEDETISEAELESVINSEMNANPEFDRQFCEIARNSGITSKDAVEKAINDKKIDEAIGEKRSIVHYLFCNGGLTKGQAIQIIMTLQQRRNQSKQWQPGSQNQETQVSIKGIISNILPIFRAFAKTNKAGSLLSIPVLLVVGYFLINAVANAKYETNIYYSISALLGMVGNKPSIEVITNKTLQSMRKHFSENREIMDVEVIKITLRHVSGNEYTGVVEAKKADVDGKFTVYVISDGESVSWETQKGWQSKFL